MDREQIIGLLESYRKNKGRIAYLEGQVAALKAEREDIMRNLVDDSVRITSSMTGMPRGGRTSDPVAAVGGRLADGYTPPRALEIDAQVGLWEADIAFKREQNRTVDRLLKGLPNRERYLITKYYIDGEVVYDVRYDYNRSYGRDYSEAHVRRLIRQALASLCSVADD